MTVPDLAHITSTTGDIRMSPRAEVSTEVIAFLRPLIERGGGQIPHIPAWHLDFWPRTAGGASVFQIAPRRASEPGGTNPYIMAVACWRADVSDDAWHQAHELARLVPGVPVLLAETPPAVPWLVVTLFPGALALRPDRLPQLADLERCVAWALIEEGNADAA